MYRQRMIAAGALATLASWVAPAPALAQSTVNQVQTARELSMVCDPQSSGVPRLEAIAYCQGFLTSFGQYHALAHPAGRPGQLFCVPSPGPSIAQSGLDFARWTRENPANAAEPAADGLLRWAEASFPCPAAPAPRRATRAAR